MKFILDTLVISETRKPSPEPAVLKWLDSQQENNLFLSVISIGEIQKGIFKLPPGKKKNELEVWLNNLIQRFTGRILDININSALLWGEIQASAQRRGKIIPVIDALIAAQAIENNMGIATRNIQDFSESGVKMVNPWNL